MSERIYNVLFLCTGNSARSVLAESALNKLGAGRFRAFSAGSHPRGEIHPATLALLQSIGYPVEGLRSKSWDEFARPGAPEIDFIFTVCDNAAGEICPIWPGRPITAHWGIDDPAAVEGEDQPEAFKQALRYLSNRISLFLALPQESHGRMALTGKLRAIGRGEGATEASENGN